jgi:hypothetical protein
MSFRRRWPLALLPFHPLICKETQVVQIPDSLGTLSRRIPLPRTYPPFCSSAVPNSCKLIVTAAIADKTNTVIWISQWEMWHSLMLDQRVPLHQSGVTIKMRIKDKKYARVSPLWSLIIRAGNQTTTKTFVKLFKQMNKKTSSSLWQGIPSNL